ncbi:LPXTG-motif protein cell wall anchor domain protein [Enterococcus faecalis 13-SD-W-01]|nr:LPXTG-motif protein cell wall anchor domain protein [Enterococcus faecalis 13-SD-W-01]
MSKNLTVILISLSFLLVSFFITAENTQASMNKSQAVVRFYQEEEAEKSEESSTVSSDNETLFPQTGNVSSVLGILGVVLLVSTGWFMIKRSSTTEQDH